MPSRRINSRDLIFQCQDSGAVWRTLTGLTNTEVDYAANEEKVDNTDYDSAGTYEEEIMQRGASLKLEGRKRNDSSTGVYDACQAALDYWAGRFGPDSLAPVRFRYPNETQWRNWSATVSRGGEGGGNNDKVGYSYTVTRSGATTLTAAP